MSQAFERKNAPRTSNEAPVSRQPTTVGGGLPANLLAGIHALAGFDLTDVRVHRNSPTPGKLDALAYARGSEVHLAPGQEEHLAHEAWHLVQQRQDRVRTRHHMGGLPINDDGALEREADEMGARALDHGHRDGDDSSKLSTGPTPASSLAPGVAAASSAPAQCMFRRFARRATPAAAAYGGFVAYNAVQQAGLNREPLEPRGDRLGAVQALHQYRNRPDTVGHDLYPLVRASHWFAGNIAAGSVGSLYANSHDLLSAENTPENRRAFLRRETDHFNHHESGAAHRIGSALTAEHREALVDAYHRRGGR